jgi:hypothetical protein
VVRDDRNPVKSDASFKMEDGRDNWIRGCEFKNGMMVDKSSGTLDGNR